MTMLTEEEAKTKWCPALLPSGHTGKRCHGAACMAWRWGEFIGPDGYSASIKCTLAPDPSRGYCGLAGKAVA